ncbi:MAG: putative bifunctional diguanylate cyclase/phosphodiesterase [Gammaproteobacteria bacterium]
MLESPAAEASAQPGFSRVVGLVQYLCSLISDPHNAAKALKLAASFEALPPRDQLRALPRVYLLLEKYLTEDERRKKFTKAGLRNLISRKFVRDLGQPIFELIFKPPAIQECLLCKQMLMSTLQSAMSDSSRDRMLIATSVWLKHVPRAAVQPLPLGLKRKCPRGFDAHNAAEWIELLVAISVELWKYLSITRGGDRARMIYKGSYRLLRYYFARLETFPVVIRMLPVELLDKEHVQQLKHQHMEAIVHDSAARMDTASDQLSAKNRSLLARLIKERSLRHQLQAELDSTEERYQLVARGTSDGIWDWDVLKGEMYLSPRWKSMLGYRDHEVGSDPADWFKRVHSEDRERLKRKIDEHLKRDTEQLTCDYRIQQKDGRYRWMLATGLALFHDDGTPYRVAGSQTDISELKRSEFGIGGGAILDGLTGLPNREAFMRKLNRAFSYAKKQPGFKFAVMFLDMDRFKMINDSLGHMVGDDLLQGVAGRLSSCVRPHDTAARLGGDEFTVLLERISSVGDTTEVAERIQKELALPFDVNGHEIFTDVSMGIAVYDRNYKQPEDMIRDADTAMYRAKASGSAKFEVFQPSMHAVVADKLQLETDMRHALQRGEFRIHYQPIIDLRTSLIKSAEALARWEHPKRGLLQPTEFIPVAEETGLIVDMERWLIHEACWNARYWKQLCPPDAAPSVSVNLSAKQFIFRDLADYVEMVIDDNGLSSGDLKLEITESLFIDHNESAVRLLSQLKKLNVPLSMDDFGTGYSSLNYLYRFPIDTIKIDRAFVSKIAENKKHEEIIRSIIMLAKNMDKDVVAEGIETAAQLAALRRHGCDCGQGFYFAEPMDFESFNAFLSNFQRQKFPEPAD